MTDTRKIRIEDVELGRARIVPRGRYYRAEWAPRGSQLRIPERRGRA